VSDKHSGPELGGSPEPLLYSVVEAARLLGIGRSKCFELIASCELRSVTIGRRRLIPWADIEDYVSRLTADGGVP
jgi:excisionase family DNA binding protein